MQCTHCILHQSFKSSSSNSNSYQIMEITEQKSVLRGGEFLIKESHFEETFIPEQFDEEAIAIRDMVRDFVNGEVLPNTAKIEKQQDGIAPTLLERAGELGILGVHMPEEFGGLNLHTNTNTMVAEEMGKTGSFCVTYAAHIGIGMLPILYYGTEAQKQQYLPGLVTGQLKACYCLTEPGSGSDALAAKTRADLSADGKFYVLNGQKMWITNSGFADVFIVFAKIDGDKFTGFIVDRTTPGLTLGAEEDKLGIKGSSTRQVFFENAQVPAENMLGEIGKGHHIAFNVLNVGRFKLGALCMGGAKANASTAIKYANERKQFNQPIANFGAIQHKLAEQAIRIFAAESSVYRVSDLMQDMLVEKKAEGHALAEAKLEAAEEYAVECAILKVLGSEVLAYVVDETVQVHGGIGYSEEFTAARAYRDARINRIYEGTNEINRLLMVDQLLKRAMKGQLNLVDSAWAVQKELASMPSMSQPEGLYGKEIEAVKNMKKCALMVAGAAVKTQMDGQVNLKEEQEILMNVADMLIAIFSTESVLHRVQKIQANGFCAADDQKVYDAILRVYLNDQMAFLAKTANDALASFATGDMLDVLLRGVNRFCKHKPANVKELRRVVADKLIAANTYCF